MIGKVIPLKCPYCGSGNLKVVDSRPVYDENTIKRRRQCLSCEKRFSTHEVIQEISIIVIKKDKTRELFDREKILKGIARSCQKRPVSMLQMEKIVDDLEKKILNSPNREIKSKEIGEFILNKLKDIDEVSYIRFASVYREFKDLNSFLEELKLIAKEKDLAKSSAY